MAPVRIDFKKVNKEMDLSYLSDWFCPLEKAADRGPALVAGGEFPAGASPRLATSTLFSAEVPGIMRKQVMAGW